MGVHWGTNGGMDTKRGGTWSETWGGVYDFGCSLPYILLVLEKYKIQPSASLRVNKPGGGVENCSLQQSVGNHK